MTEETYDGIPIRLLPINAVDWLHRGDFIRTRTQRKGATELDIEPEWATEAVVDARAVIRRDPASRSGEGLRVTGRSPGCRSGTRRDPHSEGPPTDRRMVGRERLGRQRS